MVSMAETDDDARTSATAAATFGARDADNDSRPLSAAGGRVNGTPQNRGRASSGNSGRCRSHRMVDVSSIVNAASALSSGAVASAADDRRRGRQPDDDPNSWGYDIARIGCSKTTVAKYPYMSLSLSPPFNRRRNLPSYRGRCSLWVL